MHQRETEYLHATDKVCKLINVNSKQGETNLKKKLVSLNK